ncbi:FKBP-type peptidyl-prolyl cis-trans isomerase [Luteibaculum oceani]|nr:FKBP-type peptidyl-prolyl cis-trans isomerase [Luteibaculum oceani]
MTKKLKNSLVAVAAVATMVGCNQNNQNERMEIKGDADKFSYSLGMDIGNNVKNSEFDSLSVDLMVQGIKDVMNEGELEFTVEESQEIVRSYLTKLQSKKADAAKSKGEEFLAKNAEREDVVVLESGLQYEVLKMGNGPKPGPTDKVKTHYHGTLIDGTVFDSSVERNEPASFPVNRVIPGWTEALQLMPVGSKWKLYIPSDLAYGPRGTQGIIGPNEALIFEVELLEIVK